MKIASFFRSVGVALFKDNRQLGLWPLSRIALILIQQDLNQLPIDVNITLRFIMLANFPQDQEGDEVDRYDVITISVLGFIELNSLRLCFKRASKRIAIIFLKVKEVRYNIVKQYPASPFYNMVVQVISNFEKCNIVFCAFRNILKGCFHQAILQAYYCQ